VTGTLDLQLRIAQLLFVGGPQMLQFIVISL